MLEMKSWPAITKGGKDNLAGEILHRRGKKPYGCARNRSSRMIGVHE